jgi:alkyl hydroperoxide reductase subunit F
VIGGGNSGVEAAIDLANLASEVHLLEFDARLRADAVLQDRLASLANVHVLTGAATTEVSGDGTRVTGLAYTDRATGAARRIALDGVFVQIGLLPNTEWLRDTVALCPRGEIEIDARGQTSLAGVFVAGDCTTAPFKQIVISMGSGAAAALSAFEHLVRMPIAA